MPLHPDEMGGTHCKRKSLGSFIFDSRSRNLRPRLGNMYLNVLNFFSPRAKLNRFVGFADDQMKRLLGQKGQKRIHRADLEQKHGYDTKYAMHVIRLYGEAKELMEHGRISLPRPDRDQLVEIRKGKYNLHEIQELGQQLEAEALSA